MEQMSQENDIITPDPDTGDNPGVAEYGRHDSLREAGSGSSAREGPPGVQDRPKRRYFDRYDRIFISALAVFCLFIMGFKLTQHPILVFGSSMLPTYTDGELITSRVKFTESDIGYDSVVAFKSHDKGNRLYIKRVVGMPGDTVEIRDGILYVNSVPEDRDFEYIAGDMSPVTVQEGAYFVMGDNRNNSKDSRAFGPVKFGDITNLIRTDGFRIRL